MPIFIIIDWATFRIQYDWHDGFLASKDRQLEFRDLHWDSLYDVYCLALCNGYIRRESILSDQTILELGV